jgi:hypothetical protein
MNILLPMGNKPTNERQVRPLTRLEPEATDIMFGKWLAAVLFPARLSLLSSRVWVSGIYSMDQ